MLVLIFIYSIMPSITYECLERKLYQKDTAISELRPLSPTLHCLKYSMCHVCFNGIISLSETRVKISMIQKLTSFLSYLIAYNIHECLVRTNVRCKLIHFLEVSFKDI